MPIHLGRITADRPLPTPPTAAAMLFRARPASGPIILRKVDGRPNLAEPPLARPMGLAA